MEKPNGIGQRGRKLRGEQLRPSDAVLVKARGVLQPRALALGEAVRAGESLRVQDACGLFQFIPDHADGGHEIGIAGNNHGAFAPVAKPVHQQMGGKVYVRPFFVRLVNFDGAWRRRNDGCANFAPCGSRPR